MVPLSKLRADFESGHLQKLDFIDNAGMIHRSLFGLVDSLESSGIGRIEVSPAGVLYELSGSGAKFLFRKFDKRIAPIESLNFGPYEPEILKALSWLAGSIPDKPIFDIGANIGWYTVQLALQYPNRDVVSFEPSPTTYAELQRNVEVNGLKRIRTVNAGLGEEPAETFLADVEEMSGASHVSNEVTGKAITIDTLDGFCERSGVFPGVVKADVEGFELFVLRGASQVLRKARPAWVVELLRKWAGRFGYHPNDVIHLLEGHGYVCFAIGETSLRSISEVTEETEEKNYLFLHPEVHESLIKEISTTG